MEHPKQPETHGRTLFPKYLFTASAPPYYTRGAPRRIRLKAMKYVLIGYNMFYRTLEGLLLKCLGPSESNRLLHEVHKRSLQYSPIGS